MMKNFSRGLLASLLGAVLFTALPGSVFANHSWGNYHWARTTNPFTLQLGNNVGDGSGSSLWAGYLTTASTKWSSSPRDSYVLNTVVVAGNNLSNLRKCPPTSGRVEVCNYTYGTNGWLGVAQIWITGGHIYKGSVKLNDSYFNNSRYPKYNSPAWRNMVMCQEVGHTFGLDHQDEKFTLPNLGTCMDYTSDPAALAANGQDNEFPNDHDYEQLHIIYAAHADTTTTALNSPSTPTGPGKGKMPPALTDTDSDEPVQIGTAQWGKLMRSTNGGRTEMYELDLGSGHKVVTHVIWVDPEDQPAPARGRR